MISDMGKSIFFAIFNRTIGNTAFGLYIYLTIRLLKDLFHIDISRREGYPEPGVGDHQFYKLPNGYKSENSSPGWGMKIV